jgi:hypothetical protein
MNLNFLLLDNKMQAHVAGIKMINVYHYFGVEIRDKIKLGTHRLI